MSRGRRVQDLVARVLMLLGAGALVVAVFLPWDGSGRPAIDLSLREGGGQPTVGLVLVVLAGVAALPALITASTIAAIVVGSLTAVLVLVWVWVGPDGALAPGLLTALAACGSLLLAGAVAPARNRRTVAPAAHDSRVPSSGYRELDHTADVAFEAWGPDRASCFEAALRALVGSYADTSGIQARDSREVRFEAEDDRDLLVDLLDEVIYLLDAHGVVPVEVDLEDAPDGEGRDAVSPGPVVRGRLGLCPVDEVRPVGAAPKAATLHGLCVEHDGRGWRCRAVIDV